MKFTIKFIDIARISIERRSARRLKKKKKLAGRTCSGGTTKSATIDDVFEREGVDSGSTQFHIDSRNRNRIYARRN